MVNGFRPFNAPQGRFLGRIPAFGGIIAPLSCFAGAAVPDPIRRAKPHAITTGPQCDSAAMANAGAESIPNPGKQSVPNANRQSIANPAAIGCAAAAIGCSRAISGSPAIAARAFASNNAPAVSSSASGHAAEAVGPEPRGGNCFCGCR